MISLNVWGNDHALPTPVHLALEVWGVGLASTEISPSANWTSEACSGTVDKSIMWEMFI